jgi:hypothetical protein
MNTAIIPSRATSPLLVSRFVFHDSLPHVFALDDELRKLMVQYAAYLHDLTGRHWTLGELAQGLTMRALGEEDTWNFWGWIHRDGHDDPTYNDVPSSWPLTFRGFNRDVLWVINQWSDFCAEQEGCPISPNDIVRGMTFMMIDDDEDFRAWRSRSSLRLVPACDR